MGRGDSIVRITLAIEREVNDIWRIWAMGASAKRKENKPSSSSRKKQKGLQGRGCGYQGQGRVGASSHTRQMTCYHCHQPRHMR